MLGGGLVVAKQNPILEANWRFMREKNYKAKKKTKKLYKILVNE